MTNRRGTLRELYIKRTLEKYGWIVVRASLSAGGLTGAETKPIDLVACRKGTVLFIQVSKRKHDITEKEKKELARLAGAAGATPVLCYKEQGHYTFTDLNGRPIDIT